MDDKELNIDKTMQPGTGDGTLRGAASDVPAGEGTVRTVGGMVDAASQQGGYIPTSMEDGFLIKGELYEKVQCLSDNSGEAQVFLVEKGGKTMVLKLYYPNFKVKQQVYKIISNADFEMIMQIYDFGKVYVEGVRRDYELMEYLQGGTLGDYHLDGDEVKFRRIALQAAAALAYIHNLGLIHKDIKPGNFFFRDEAQTEVVLGDFGISSVIGEGEIMHRTTQARTPVYAAPEMYSDVIDGVVEISQASDYYSLGLTLLALWIGRSPFNVGERTIMHRKNEGRLPGIDDLPERVKMIVKGLTTVNATTRWAYKDVERWFLGENPDVDQSSPFLKYKSFVVDPERNLVAESVQELVPMLIDNERIARGYLYGGRLTKWFEKSGNLRVSTMLKEIVEEKFPTDQKAGFVAAIYAMDPKWPYRDVAGNECGDSHTIAATLLTHAPEYSVLLKNPNDRLWLYVESHQNSDVNRMRGYFQDVDNKDLEVAIKRTAIEIDPDMPFIHKKKASTTEDIIAHFGSSDANDDEWRSLTDGRLLSWMYCHADSAACEKLRATTEGKTHTRTLAYKVLYDLAPMVAYDLKEAFTPKKVGEIFAEDLLEWQNLTDSDFEVKIREFADANGRFAYYAAKRGWNTLVEEMRNCFNLQSHENKDRLGVYDLRTAAYRFCRILGETPRYVLPSGGILKDGLDIEKKYHSEARADIRQGKLTQWLAVFYHENPKADFSVEYDYERSLRDWLLAIGDLDPQQAYYRRYIKAREETKRRTEAFKKSYESSMERMSVWKTVMRIMIVVWLVMVVLCWAFGKPFASTFMTVCVPVGIGTALIVARHFYFKGLGPTSILMWAALGFASSALPFWLMRFIESQAPVMLMPTVLLISIIYVAICLMTINRKEKGNDEEMVNEIVDEDVKTSLLEPLYFTFKTKASRYNGSRFSQMANLRDHFTAVSTEAMAHHILWSLLALGLSILALIHLL